MADEGICRINKMFPKLICQLFQARENSESVGARGGNRTRDLRITSALLYH